MYYGASAVYRVRKRKFAEKRNGYTIRVLDQYVVVLDRTPTGFTGSILTPATEVVSWRDTPESAAREAVRLSKRDGIPAVGKHVKSLSEK